MKVIAAWKQRAGLLKNEIRALYLAYRDPRVPWYARVFMAAVIGYFLSPIDLIPDFIPVLGYLDDLIIVPAGIFLAMKMIPQDVLEECREKAKYEHISTKTKWVAAAVLMLTWMVVIYFILRLILGMID